MPSPAIVADDALLDVQRQLGHLQGQVGALTDRLGSDNTQLEHRIASAAHDALEASKAAADLDRRLRGERGDNGIQGRLATLESAHRTMRAVLGWVAGIVAALVVGVGVQAFRAWAGG